MTYTLVFDIETIPDVAAGRKLYSFLGGDAEVAEQMFAKRREETGGSDFLRLHLQKVVVISAVLVKGDHVKVWSFGDLESTEAEVIQRFFDLLQQRTPILVSWNGGGFDLPVLHYRMLVNGIQAPKYWETGELDQSFRWNNYLNRYHYRHLDLMDVLACYQAKANAPLDEIASLLGAPGKMGMHGDKVWHYYLQGRLAEIRAYCETDVLNTYLVYLHFEYMRGMVRWDELQHRKKALYDHLKQQSSAHLDAFLAQWDFTV